MPCENHGRREELLAAATGPERARVGSQCSASHLDAMTTHWVSYRWALDAHHVPGRHTRVIEKAQDFIFLTHCVREGHFHANV